jgi:endonuclease III
MGKNVVEVEKKLLKVVPAESKVDVHHWLIYTGVILVQPANQNAAVVLLKTCVSLKIRLNNLNFV